MTTDLATLGPLPDTPTRAQIEAFAALMAGVEAQEGLPAIVTAHHFSEGIYGRAVTIPAGTALVGAAHLAGHLNVSSGDITVWTEDGMKRLTGVHVLPSRPGAMRVGYAHADTTWVTVHANKDDCRDIAQLEAKFVENPEQLATRRGGLTHNSTEQLQ